MTLEETRSQLSSAQSALTTARRELAETSWRFEDARRLYVEALGVADGASVTYRGNAATVSGITWKHNEPVVFLTWKLPTPWHAWVPVNEVEVHR